MTTDSADEVHIIRTLLAPLATDPAARGLVDDAALYGGMVVTTDAIVEGVHFLASDPIQTIAMKALRVNVSDLVAKGAKPKAALMTLIWPDGRPAAEIAQFVDGFGRDLKQFGMALLGGDITSTPGPLTVSVTAFGEPIGGRTPSRADAKAGDDVWLVGGEIGSAWLGLQLRTGRLALGDLQRGRTEDYVDSRALAPNMPPYLTLPGEDFDAEAAWLMSTYLAPFVRVECADIVARFANASMDVSDGLAADARKLADASGVALRIAADAIPLSIPAHRWIRHGGAIEQLVAGGDDYVVLFTAAPEVRAALEGSDADHALRLVRIGRVEAGEGVQVLDAAGQALVLPTAGFVHRLGR
ncbi:MAG: thiamine-phosphate kinase [Hyphomonadaceae bacterium]|nr:thiamine-phosphate kinase [Hyphomonadaceae bacterium]